MINTITKRQQKEKELIIENLKRIPIIEVACSKSGVARATYYRWRQQDAEFSKLADESIEEGVRLINDMAESQLLTAIKEGNISAIFYWLNHRHHAYTTRVEITQKNEEMNKLTPKEEVKIKQALLLAGLLKEGEKKNEKQQQKNQ